MFILSYWDYEQGRFVESFYSNINHVFSRIKQLISNSEYCLDFRITEIAETKKLSEI